MYKHILLPVDDTKVLLPSMVPVLVFRSEAP